MKKELDLTKGWLKPNRLLQITGKTAQEVLKEEAREKKVSLKKSIHASSETALTILKPPSGAFKRPRDSVSSTQGLRLSKLTIKDVVEKYMSNDDKKNSLLENSIQSENKSLRATPQEKKFN